MPRLKVVFMGTPEFALGALDAIVRAGHEIACVYTQPPKPAGRGQDLRKSAVHDAALARRLQVRCPVSLKSEAEIAALRGLGADVIVVVAYGLMLPREILDLPPFGCLNIHASLLPRWRGAAPIERAILAGDKETGVTIMSMVEALDAGPILGQSRIAIDRATDAGQLHDQLAELGARMIVEILATPRGEIRQRPQPEVGVTYARKIAKDEARLDWRNDAAQLERQVRAFHPRPGAFATIAGERVKVLSATLVPDAKGSPGTIIDDRLCVACGTGALRLTRLQRPGKSAMNADDMLRGYPVPGGTVLS